jgi:hypothetical protein
MVEERESFLKRWTRRKTEQREQALADAAPNFPPAEGAAKAVPSAAVAPDQLPSIDDLTAESDFTAFLKAGVPEELKRLALRKLWRTDPVFANLDGLVEYGDDFAAPFRSPGAVATLFRLGQGMPGPEENSEGNAEESADTTLTSDIETAAPADASKEVDNGASKVKNCSDNDPTAVG